MLSSASHLSWRSFDALQFSVWSGHAYYSSFHSYTNRICFLRPIHHNWHSVFVSKWTKMSYHPCIVLTVFLWLFHWELTCETHVKPWVKCMWKLSLKRSISHPFHIYFTIQNFTSMWNMHVKCLWKVCEKHVKIGHFITLFLHDFHTYTPGSGWT